MIEKVYDRSTCLYHKVLDANEALQRYQEIGLVQAKEMYTEAVTNKNLAACGERENELTELRSFSLFRLALVNAYAGDPDAAAENVTQLEQAYPDSIFTQLGQAWLGVYQSSGDIGNRVFDSHSVCQGQPGDLRKLVGLRLRQSDLPAVGPVPGAGHRCAGAARDRCSGRRRGDACR